MSRSRTPLVALLATSLAVIVSAIGSPVVARADEAICSALTTPVYQRVNPSNGANFLTTSTSEMAEMIQAGFTEDHGTPFEVSLNDGSGLQPVTRLYRESSGDYLWTKSPGEVESAQSRHEYERQELSFYVTSESSDCVRPVHRYLGEGGKHRLVVTDADRDQLSRTGWHYEGIAFYAAPMETSATEPAPAGDGDSKFTFAVMPDTQQEVLLPTDARFKNRSDWLVKNRSSLDLRFVTHSGDVVNWDTPDHSQYKIARDALRPLELASIPYSLALGNHDTAAVCPGGSACDPKKTRVLFRDTSTFNEYFTADQFGKISGAFEPGKVDNAYATYEAGGVKWMVLTMEMWPRTAAVDWAKKVVASHPHHNVMLVTHNYLTSSGDIGADSGYGQNSPQYLFDNLVSQYSNVKFVFSGHVGTTGNRVDTGVHGNKIYSFLQTIHDNRTNPVRLVEVDTEANSIKTWLYSPYTNQSYPEWTREISGVTWVR